MRKFYDPATIAIIGAVGAGLGAVSTAVSLFKGEPKVKQPQIPSPEAVEKREQKVTEEAERKTRALAAARGGRSQTLLSGANFNISGLETARSTLLGGGKR